LALAAALVEDSHSVCRWQACIIVGEFIDTAPERVWQIARRLGSSRNADIRIAATTVLLEHLLQCQPRQMIPRFMAELRRGGWLFAAAVARCANFGEGTSKTRIQRVLDRARAMGQSG